MRWSGWLLLVLAAGLAKAAGQAVSADIDAGLARSIAETMAVDDHAHPVLPPPLNDSDRDFDALPVENMAPATDPVAWRTDNPQLPAAWAALWGFAGAVPLDAEGLKQLGAARARVRAREKEHYAEWVLDQAGIRTMLANRVAMGPQPANPAIAATPHRAARPPGEENLGLTPPRFRWVPYADALLFPLNNAALAAASPDRGQFFPMEERLRARYLEAVGLKELPATLGVYLSRVVTPTLERQRAGGAVAEKFEIAYLRSFDFGNPTRAQAERVYARWAHAGASELPNPAAYKILQDFLFRYIAGECGRLGMPVHLHTMSGGGAFFNVAGANPLLLEPVLDDPALRKTSFVLLHGGWPFVREAGALLQKPNVYLDLSQETLTFPPRTLAGWLREWLETYPGKVLFGTDGYPYSEAMGWEESAWLASRTGRLALGLALTGMLRDGEISRPRAEQIARDVLRNSAAALYGLR